MLARRSCRSAAHSAIRSGRTHTSSMINAVREGAQPADKPKQFLAHLPCVIDRIRLTREVDRVEQVGRLEQIDAQALVKVELLRVLAAELDDQGG